MKLFSLIRRHITPMVVLCCFVFFGTQSAHAATCAVLTDGARHAATTPTVVMLRSTVSTQTGSTAGAGETSDCSSLEAVQAMAAPLGLNVEIDDDATWGAKTQSDFATYSAIVLGDPGCVGGTAPITQAENTAGMWGPAITGDVALVGTDPVFHFVNGAGSAADKANLTQNAIAYAVSVSGKTGAYICLSCYYATASVNTPVPVLAPFGSFTVQGTDWDDSTIVASGNPLVNTPNVLTNTGLSNWSSASHEGFNSLPGTFTAVVTTQLSATSTPILPYILTGQVQVQTSPPQTFNTNGGTAQTIVPSVFISTTDKRIEHDEIFPDSSTLTFPIGSATSGIQVQDTNTPISNDPVWSTYVSGWPFATSLLFPHAGNGDTNTGSMYTILCFDSTHPPKSGQCPFPTNPGPGRHVGATDVFDLPKDTSGNFIQPPVPFGTTLSFIHVPPDTTSWTSSSTSPNPKCTVVFNSGFNCPAEDILADKYGTSNGGGFDTKNGSYALVSNVPMPCSAWKVNGVAVNAPTPCVQGNSTFFVSSALTGGLTFDFLVTPPQCPTYTGESCGNGWIAAPVNKLFWTFDPVTSAVDYPNMFTDLNDLDNCPGTNTNNGANCTVTSLNQPGAGPPAAPVEFTTTPVAEPDGQFELQVSSSTTVGIRERNITIIPVGSTIPCPDPPQGRGDANRPAGGWTPPCYSTKLFNALVNVDNTAPTVSTPVLSPPPVNGTYAPGQSVTASVNCVDVISGGVASDVAMCAKDSFTPNPVPPAASPTPRTSSGNPVPTSTLGKQNFTLSATDQAGNVGTSSPVSFCVGYTITSVDRNGVIGFTAPVDNPGPGPGVIVNTVGSRQAIPLSLTVVDCNGAPVSNLDLVGSTNAGTVKTVVLSATNAPSGTCAAAVMDNSITTNAAGNSGWQILGNGGYQFNWKPGAPVGSCLAFSVNLGDAIPHTAYFSFTRH